MHRSVAKLLSNSYHKNFYYFLSMQPQPPAVHNAAHRAVNEATVKSSMTGRNNPMLGFVLGLGLAIVIRSDDKFLIINNHSSSTIVSQQ
jgi:hypothetical protein